MSKQKGKLKASKSDIVSRIVTALLAGSVPVVAYFMNLIYYVVESSVFAFLAQLQGNTEDDGSTYDYISLHYFFSEILTKGAKENTDAWSGIWENTQSIHVPMILTAVFFALIIITAIVIIIVSIFSNSKKIPLCFSCFGFVCAIGMFIAFNRAAEPLTDGTISLASFFESALAQLILPYVASISVLHLSSAWVMILIIYFCIALWLGAQLLITLGEPKAPKISK